MKRYDIKIKRGSFRKTQEKFLMKEGMTKKRRLNEEDEYQYDVEDALEELFEVANGENSYADSVSDHAWSKMDNSKTEKSIRKCASDIEKRLQKCVQEIKRL